MRPMSVLCVLTLFDLCLLSFVCQNGNASMPTRCWS